MGMVLSSQHWQQLLLLLRLAAARRTECPPQLPALFLATLGIQMIAAAVAMAVHLTGQGRCTMDITWVWVGLRFHHRRRQMRVGLTTTGPVERAAIDLASPRGDGSKVLQLPRWHMATVVSQAHPRCLQHRQWDQTWRRQTWLQRRRGRFCGSRMTPAEGRSAVGMWQATWPRSKLADCPRGRLLQPPRRTLGDRRCRQGKGMWARACTQRTSWQRWNRLGALRVVAAVAVAAVGLELQQHCGALGCGRNHNEARLHQCQLIKMSRRRCFACSSSHRVWLDGWSRTLEPADSPGTLLGAELALGGRA